MNLSRTEYFILTLLINARKDMYGLEMIKESGNKLKRGTIYTTLNRMEDKGIICSFKEQEVAPGLTTQRRMYQITGAGVKVAQSYHNEINNDWAGAYA